MVFDGSQHQTDVLCLCQRSELSENILCVTSTFEAMTVKMIGD